MKITSAACGLTLALGAFGALPQLATQLATQRADAAATRSVRQEEKRPLAVGDVAPQFTLNDGTGELITIGGKSEQWTVLAFYPKALTGG